MEAYRSGDRAAFSALYDRMAPRVMAFFVASFRDRDVAAELLQRTFFNVHRARETYRPGSPVKPWIFTIAARVRIDELRRRYRTKANASEEEIDAAIERASIEASRADEPGDERTERVRAALRLLPESQRIVVHMHRYEDMTLAEIAKSLGTTEMSVRQRAFRAYEKLREILSDLGPARSTAKGGPR
jgi:RNA polymerase sigma-70 factor (ECF subfamily)